MNAERRNTSHVLRKDKKTDRWACLVVIEECHVRSMTMIRSTCKYRISLVFVFRIVEAILFDQYLLMAGAGVEALKGTWDYVRKTIDGFSFVSLDFLELCIRIDRWRKFR